MKLHWSPRSPFVRKVMIVLREKGMLDEVECVRSVVAFAAMPNQDLLSDNPLNKIPTLVLDDGRSLFDSRVICEYLEATGGGPRLLPEAGDARFAQLRWQALGDGLTDVLLLWRSELTRPNGISEILPKAFESKVRAAMARLNAEADQLDSAAFGLGHVAIICALGQLDFRYLENHWRQAFPDLAKWHAKVLARPSVNATVPEDDVSPGAVSATFDPNKPVIDFMSSQA